MQPRMPVFFNNFSKNMNDKVPCTKCGLFILPRNMKRHQSRGVCSDVEDYKLTNGIFFMQQDPIPSNPKERFIAKIGNEKEFAAEIWEELTSLRQQVKNFKETFQQFSNLCENSSINFKKLPSFTEKIEKINPIFSKLWKEFTDWQSESEFRECPIDFSTANSFLSYKYQSLKGQNKQRNFVKFYPKFKHVLRIYNKDIVIEDRSHFDQLKGRNLNMPSKIKPCLEPQEVAEMIAYLYENNEKQLFLSILFLSLYALRINSLITFEINHINIDTDEITFYDIKTMIYFKRQNFILKYIKMVYSPLQLENKIGQYFFGGMNLEGLNRNSFTKEKFIPFSSINKEENVTSELTLCRKEILRRKNCFNKRLNRFLLNYLGDKYPPNKYSLTSHMFRVTSSQNIFKENFEEFINVAKNNINHTKKSKNIFSYIPADIVTNNNDKLLQLIDKELEKIDKKTKIKFELEEKDRIKKEKARLEKEKKEALDIENENEEKEKSNNIKKKKIRDIIYGN